jgi:hypothetical protein
MTNQNQHNLSQIGPTTRGTMTLCNESREEAVGLIPFLTPRKTVRLATWNVRTMYEAGRTAQVTKEIKHDNICLLGLNETKCLHSGWLRLTSGEMLLYSGCTEEGSRAPPPVQKGRVDTILMDAQCALHWMGTSQLPDNNS